MKAKSTRRCLVVIAVLAFAASGGTDFFRGTTASPPPSPGPHNTINLKTTVLNLNTEAPLCAAPGRRYNGGNHLRQVDPAFS